MLRTATAVLAALTLAAAPGTAQEPTLDELEALEFRHIGPVGNRVIAVQGVAGNPDVYYAGAASGGVWKTVDGGLTWEPVFDDRDVHSIGALAVAPSDPQVVWAGTGETSIRSNVSLGDGVYRSTDGGESWTHMGLERTGRIGEIVVHPWDPDIAWVAALGHTHSPQPERGVYRTRDGGETWERVLFVDESTGASALAMDPEDPRTLFAGTWQIEVHTWGRVSGGPGSGLHVTRDGGDTWTRLEGRGLPEPPLGKVDVCTTPADPDRIYALVETGDGVPGVYDRVEGGEAIAAGEREPETGELWRSDDGGRSWELVNHSRDLGGRQAYYTHCAASTDDPDEAYFLSHNYFKTLNGGGSYIETSGAAEPIWDHHDMWIDPEDGDRQIVVGDGGIAITRNRGRTWHRIQLPVAQMYHVTVDDRIPYYVYGNRQDGPSTHGPSNSRTGGTIPRGMWRAVGGGESGFATPDTVAGNIVWSSASGAGAQGGIVVRYNRDTGQFRQVEVWPESTIGWPEKDLRYRFQWTFPVLISPHDPGTVYVTSQHVHRTNDGGQSWQEVSPDLTTNDTTRMRMSGGLTPDNIGVEYCCVIYAFDESPVREGVLWAGTNDGLVHVSRDGGRSWTEVTENLPDAPADGVVRNIDASRRDPGRAYLTIEAHQQGDFSPYAYRTTDFGESWTRITEGIDEGPLAFTRWIHEDPERDGLLYLGTENRLYVSFDDGDSWRSLMTNLPPAPMYGLVVQDRFDDLVVGTYGRGFWILDDVTPLQQLTPEVEASDLHLFEPRRAYRFRPVTSPMAMFDDPSAGENPPYGASINYWLGAEPEGDVRVRILNEAGDTIRTLDGTARRGLNRVWWDLEEEPSAEIRLRTKPLHADWVEMNDEGWRPLAERIQVLAPPGTYAAEVEVDGRTQRRQLEVVKDPHSEGTLEDIEEQTAMVRELRTALERGGELVNRLEWIRSRLLDVRAMLLDSTSPVADSDAGELRRAAEELDDELIAVEERLFQMKLTGTGQDGVRWPTKLLGRIGSLADKVAVADFPPTDQAREVQRILEERLAGVESDAEELIATDVARFNRMLRERGVEPLPTGSR